MHRGLEQLAVNTGNAFRRFDAAMRQLAEAMTVPLESLCELLAERASLLKRRNVEHRSVVKSECSEWLQVAYTPTYDRALLRIQFFD